MRFLLHCFSLSSQEKSGFWLLNCSLLIIFLPLSDINDYFQSVLFSVFCHFWCKSSHDTFLLLVCMSAYLNRFSHIGSAYQSNRIRERQISGDLGQKKREWKSEKDVRHQIKKMWKAFLFITLTPVCQIYWCLCLKHLKCRRKSNRMEKKILLKHENLYHYKG